MAFSINRYGAPTGSDQTSPYTQTSPTDCPSGQIRDSRTGRCKPIQDQDSLQRYLGEEPPITTLTGGHYPSPQVPNAPQPLPNNGCPANTTWNESSRTCQPNPNPSANCPSGTTWNGTACVATKPPTESGIPAPGTPGGKPLPATPATFQYEQWREMIRGVPGTVAGLLSLQTRLKPYGIQIEMRNGVPTGNIIYPGGINIDVLNNAGQGGTGWRGAGGGWGKVSPGDAGGGSTSTRSTASSISPVTPSGQPSQTTPLRPTTAAPAPFGVTPFAQQHPLPTYEPFQFETGSYEEPSQRTATAELIDRMLANTSLSPEVVAQMREQQKGTILGGAEQLRQGLLQGAASRGVSQGGNTQAQLRDVDLNSLESLSGAYRDIDINKAFQDRTDQLNAVNASQGFQQQLLNEFLALENLGLSRQQLQADEGARAFEGAALTNDREFEQWLAQNQLGLSANEQQFLQWLRQQGLLFDYAQLAQGGNQFDRTHQLAIARFLAES